MQVQPDRADVTSVTICHILIRAGCDATKGPVFIASWGWLAIFGRRKWGNVRERLYERREGGLGRV